MSDPNYVLRCNHCHVAYLVENATEKNRVEENACAACKTGRVELWSKVEPDVKVK